MLKYLMIGLGGAIGSVLRYVMGELSVIMLKTSAFIPTMLINVSGSFVIGFLAVIVEKFVVLPQIKLFIFVGVLGGYTTFSTFSLETFHLIKAGEYRLAFVNIGCSVFLSLLAVFLGYFLAKTIWR